MYEVTSCVWTIKQTRKLLLNVNIILIISKVVLLSTWQVWFTRVLQLQVRRRCTIIFAIIALAICFMNTNCGRTPVIRSVVSPTIVYDLSWIRVLITDSQQPLFTNGLSMRPSMQCQRLQNPKAPRPLGRRWWHLACILYGSWDKTARKQNFDPVPHRATSNVAQSGEMTDADQSAYTDNATT